VRAHPLAGYSEIMMMWQVRRDRWPRDRQYLQQQTHPVPQLPFEPSTASCGNHSGQSNLTALCSIIFILLQVSWLPIAVAKHPTTLCHCLIGRHPLPTLPNHACMQSV
jgi:hypothetical protein